MKPTFTIKDAVAYGWRKLSENFWFLVLLTLAFVVISAALDKGGHSRFEMSLADVANIVVSWFAMFTFVRVGLKAGKGERPFWNDLFAFKPALFGYYIVGSVIYTVANGVGLVLLVVPGLIAIVRLGFFGFILVEEGIKPVHALKKSWAITRGRFWPLLGLGAVLFLINLAGALAAGIGLLITAPLSLLATVYVYERIKAAPVPLVAEPIAPPTVPPTLPESAPKA